MCVGTHTTLYMHDQKTTLGMQFFLPPWDQIQVTRLDTRLPGCLLADTHGGLYILLVCLFCLFVLCQAGLKLVSTPRCFGEVLFSFG